MAEWLSGWEGGVPTGDRSTEFQALPENLPVPEDDGAAAHLLDAPLLRLCWMGPAVSRASWPRRRRKGPWSSTYTRQTGVPGRPLPEGWNPHPGRPRLHAAELCVQGQSGGVGRPRGDRLRRQRSEALSEQPRVRRAGADPLPAPKRQRVPTRRRSLACPPSPSARAATTGDSRSSPNGGRSSKSSTQSSRPQDNASDVIAWLRARARAELGPRVVNPG